MALRPQHPAGARFLLRLAPAGRVAGTEARVRILVLLTLTLTALDHWTTFVCLRRPVAGWSVTEANPIADWLFASLGLVPGLLLDSAVTLGAIAFLVTTDLVPHAAKSLIFAAIVTWTGYAVVNNAHAIAALGLSPLGTI
jgi:hypothetical protein